ncbi:hypothetical protein D623_10026221 [Myotis brandtii]|uniref:Uncharacterized protein n=1 Tax=Myotis brandtii TaxID=109478 RepID=S7MSS2_MYOBR|nr:hypothetical protein D623_10026221 [Myotis brandtii]
MEGDRGCVPIFWEAELLSHTLPSSLPIPALGPQPHLQYFHRWPESNLGPFSLQADAVSTEPSRLGQNDYLLKERDLSVILAMSTNGETEKGLGFVRRVRLSSEPPPPHPHCRERCGSSDLQACTDPSSEPGPRAEATVLLPSDNPYGRITGTVKRKLASRL